MAVVLAFAGICLNFAALIKLFTLVGYTLKLLPGILITLQLLGSALWLVVWLGFQLLFVVQLLQTYSFFHYWILASSLFK